MDTITLDMETFYSREYSLSKLTTEEYIRDRRFQVIGVSVKVNEEPPEWFSGTARETIEWLHGFDWENSALVAHNTMFDAAILSWRCGIKPARLIDTLSMSRAMFGVDAGHSLKALAQRLHLPAKGDEVTRAMGKRRLDFTPQELADYAEYCRLDVHLTYEAFRRMVERGFPKQELQLIDATLRMFTDPMLELDGPLLEGHLISTQRRKQQLLDDAGVTDKKDLMSNNKFADMLRGLGVEPPMKTSPTTGKETYAFAKTDEAFRELEDHENPHVQALVSARLGNKSTLEETRTQRFIDMSKRGRFPVPLYYYGAHTGRWSGRDKINLQNLPSRGPNAKKIKQGIIAPEGHMLIDCDSSQIEARVLAWLAEQEDLVQAFRNKEDVYKIMASSIYGTPVEDIDKGQRQVGKTVILGCFGPDTEVLTPRGWVRIVDVQDTDTVWDGEEWVTHGGVIPQGKKTVLTQHGVSATLDHEILTERGWVEWSEACGNPRLFQSALRLGSSSWSSGRAAVPPADARLVGSHGVDAHAAGRALSTERTSLTAAPRAATTAQKLRRTLSGIGNTAMRALTMLRASVSSTAFQPALVAATTPITPATPRMEDGVSRFGLRGGTTEQSSCGTCKPYPGSMTQTSNSTGLITTWGTCPETSGLSLGETTSEIGAQCANSKRRCSSSRQRMQTYDVAYAGPRNRYTIRTACGPIVVHNCGYGVGHVKLQAFLKMQAGVDVPLDEAKRIIDIYRHTNDRISGLWREAQSMLKGLLHGDKYQVGRSGVVEVVPSEEGIRLPSGLFIRYNGLYAEEGEKGLEMFYKTRKGPSRIYGGKNVENLCQALARCIIGEQLLKINKRYRVVLTVHDSVVSCVPEDQLDEARDYIETCMRWTPDWAEGLPVDCESGVGKSYGACE